MCEMDSDREGYDWYRKWIVIFIMLCLSMEGWLGKTKREKEGEDRWKNGCQMKRGKKRKVVKEILLFVDYSYWA